MMDRPNEGAIMDFNLGVWVRSPAFEQHEVAFTDNFIAERFLPRLPSEDLKDFGVTIVEHQHVLPDAIADLRSDTRAISDVTQR
jgi:SAM domain (Sterile alpha motif)